MAGHICHPGVYHHPRREAGHLEGSQGSADQRLYANPSPERPRGAQAVADTNPDWNYQGGGSGQLRVRYMIECILEGMEASSHKVVNLLRLDEVTRARRKPSHVS